jgi:uncharacterized membrane protein YbhN (UPF0104 family)
MKEPEISKPDQRAKPEAAESYTTHLIPFAAAALLAMLAAVLVADAAGLDRVARVSSHIHPIWIVVCFGGQLLGYLGYVVALRNVASVDGGPRLTFALTARTVLAGFGVYAAAHAAGGFAVDYWALRRAGLERDQAIARVAGLGALEYAVLAPAALASALALIAGAGDVEDAMTMPWLAVVPGFALAVWLSSPKRSPRLSDPASGGRLRSAFAHAVAGIVTLRTLATRPRQHLAGLVGVTLYWLGDIATLWAALKTFGVEIGTPALILAFATGYVASRRSLPAGGAGIVEVLMTFALVWVGIPLAPALAAVLLYRIFNFWLPILPALAVLPSVRELRRQFRGAERGADSSPG